MLKKPKECIIIGGGSSISEGISKGLWNKLKGKFTIGTNYSYKFFEPTIQTYVDSTFYNQNVNELKNLPLVIGQGRNTVKNPELPNAFAIPCNSVYNRNLEGGVYSAKLVGLYALSLAIYLLNTGTLWLLGYDYGNINDAKDKKNRKITHFYQNQIEHRGIGHTTWYDTKGRVEEDFGCYKNEKQCRIINVSPLSKINIFPKINYNQFFKELSPEIYDQNELREWIKNELKGKIK